MFRAVECRNVGFAYQARYSNCKTCSTPNVEEDGRIDFYLGVLILFVASGIKAAPR